MSTIEERLWGRTRKTDSGCWEFTGARARINGYGRISYGGQVDGAHRVAYMLTRGPIPDGMHVLHSCDNPPCVNPDHLRAGTRFDNMREMVERGRASRVVGESHWSAKLSNQDVIDIRALHAAGVRYVRIAERYGISHSTAWCIANGQHRRAG